jgi:hypothetical protein
MKIVNKLPIVQFLRTQGIPVSEALFAGVILGDQGIDVHAVRDAFDINVKNPVHLAAVEAALEEAKDRVLAREALRAAYAVAGVAA